MSQIDPSNILNRILVSSYSWNFFQWVTHTRFISGKLSVIVDNDSAYTYTSVLTKE